MPRLEIESKYELSEDGFECLQRLGRIAKKEEQLNVYYDANWILAEHAATLRVRFLEHQAPILTLKVPIEMHGSCRVMKEFEIPIDASETGSLPSPKPTSIDVERDLPPQIRQYVLRFGIHQLQRVGWVRNTRLTIAIDGAGEVELDRLTLPDGRVVYEAEVESEDQSVQTRLGNLICQCAPEAQPARISKFQRFREAASSTAQR